jgi:hypothetical protein
MRHLNIIAIVVSFCLGLAAPAFAISLLATFDSFAEGTKSTTIQDGGITFSELDVRFGTAPDPFVIETTDSGLFGSAYSPPNYLTPLGFISGQGFSFGRFGSARLTFGSVPAIRASLEIFSPFIPNFENILTLEARREGRPVATSFIAFKGSGPVLHQTLTVTGGMFDELRLVASEPQGEEGVVFIGLDNVRVETVPEPAMTALVGLGFLLLIRFLYLDNEP